MRQLTRREPDFRRQRYRDAETRMWESVGVAPTERYVDLDRTGTAMRIQEVGTGPPVLFIHGTSNAGASWAPLVAAMPDHRCLVVDRPGCGLSEPLTAPFAEVSDLEAFADVFVADVLDSLELETASVVATSYGGYIAIRSVAATPQRFDRMVQLGYCFGAPIAKIPVLMRIGSIAPLGRVMARVRPTKRMVRAMLKQIGLRNALASGRISDEFIDWFLAVLRDTDTLANELEANPPIIYPIKGMNPDMVFSNALLRRIEIPMKFLWGTDDLMGGADVGRSFTANLPNAELDLMAGAGHAPWVDDPDYAARTVGKFIG